MDMVMVHGIKILFRYYFLNIKLIVDQVFKIKETSIWFRSKQLEKPDTFNPPENDNFEKIGRTIEVLYQRS